MLAESLSYKYHIFTLLKILFLVEQDEHFLVKSKEYLEPVWSSVGNLYCAGLQNFKFTKDTYDVIWFQWVLGHLQDDHLVIHIFFTLLKYFFFLFTYS
jgi:protein N-terminal methyltransferase